MACWVFPLPPVLTHVSLPFLSKYFFSCCYFFIWIVATWRSAYKQTSSHVSHTTPSVCNPDQHEEEAAHSESDRNLHCHCPGVSARSPSQHISFWESLNPSTAVCLCCPWPLSQRTICLFTFIFFLVGLEFELRALHLHSSCCTAWGTPPVHPALAIL
jgi:hypothetical protein